MPRSVQIQFYKLNVHRRWIPPLVSTVNNYSCIGESRWILKCTSDIGWTVCAELVITKPSLGDTVYVPREQYTLQPRLSTGHLLETTGERTLDSFSHRRRQILGLLDTFLVIQGCITKSVYMVYGSIQLCSFASPKINFKYQI